ASGGIVCQSAGAGFSVALTATDATTDVTATTAFRIELVSGDNIIANAELGIQPSSWAPTPVAAGKATYRAVPLFENREGIAAIFTLEARPAYGFADFSDLIFDNGDLVQAVNLNALVPAGAMVTWTNYNTDIGLPASGAGIIPAFRASNTTATAIASLLEFTLVYADGKGCPNLSTRHTITVNPKTNLDYDLMASATVANNGIVCQGGQFNVTLGSNPAGASFRIEFVSGDNIIAGAFPQPFSGSTWQPTPVAAGKATYRAVPLYENREGIAVTFTLEALASLSAISISDWSFQNGDFTPSINLSSLLPTGAVANWTNDKPEIGLPASGAGIIPAFRATNTGTGDLVASIEVELKYADGMCPTSSTPLCTITVTPKTIEDADLMIQPVESQVVCSGSPFTDVTLTASHRFNTPFSDPTSFLLELIDGKDILGTGTIQTIPSSNHTAPWNISTASATTTGYGTYRVTPVWNNKRGTSSVFTLRRLQEASVEPVSDIVLCNNSALPLIHFTGSANTVFKWEIVDGAGAPTVSLLGLPDRGSNEITLNRVINSTNHLISDSVKVTPILVSAETGLCPAPTPFVFQIIVMPTPVTHPVENLLVGENQPVAEIPFTGTATKFLWTNSNPSISTAAPLVYSGEGHFPAFTSQNTGGDPVVSQIAVTPVYEYTHNTKMHVCEGEPMEFYICVAIKPYIDPIADITVCENGFIQPIRPVGLPDGSSYHITWAGGEDVGLPSHLDYSTQKRKYIPPVAAAHIHTGLDYLDIPSKSTVIVTPLLTFNGQDFTGDEVEFTITVLPETRPKTGYEQNQSEEISGCISSDIVLNVLANGYNLHYQWYKDHFPIAGATSPTYTITASDNAIGRYYAMVTGNCNSVQTKTWNITVKPNVVSQRWDDVLVLNCNTALNGGYDFVSYQWYAVNGGKLDGKDMSYLYFETGMDRDDKYFVSAITRDGLVFESCPVELRPVVPMDITIYPNPVRCGSEVTIEFANHNPQTVIQLLDMMSRVVNVAKPDGPRITLRAPALPGIYVIRIVTGNDIRSFKLVVE
ncbi:MAG: T9SS type A sorting domain-containing protein, partial [Bacteroidales bacterium]|nr:T9SS type A sorting domain-containing protein [Bacteroidales bacterium]